MSNWTTFCFLAASSPAVSETADSDAQAERATQFGAADFEVCSPVVMETADSIAQAAMFGLCFQSSLYISTSTETDLESRANMLNSFVEREKLST